jgi:gas vesicle protein
MIKEIADNLYGTIGVAIGSVSGIVVALISNRQNRKNKQSQNEKIIADLGKEVEDLKNKFDSLKTSFTLVFDEMERGGELPAQLKDFKKIFDL